jgi:hypothetical protein
MAPPEKDIRGQASTMGKAIDRINRMIQDLQDFYQKRAD